MPKVAPGADGADTVRTTIDLLVAEQKTINTLRSRIATQIGQDVPFAELVRVLVRLAKTDRNLAKVVGQQLLVGAGELHGAIDKDVLKHTEAE
ncbi:hypothetical protein [Kutzneria buriramensis]|uniref:Uncharacterized protein n=1 Tax=Kutzneria buriramensis TaxID=1045776 RepID=A0A3E0G852_9PSEU|nr:hypothetical protein [Kutzneria buriramensis]REH18024.1 hypothetical protein BCF44_13811 [Kutzneria buriramensis]